MHSYFWEIPVKLKTESKEKHQRRRWGEKKKKGTVLKSCPDNLTFAQRVWGICSHQWRRDCYGWTLLTSDTDRNKNIHCSLLPTMVNLIHLIFGREVEGIVSFKRLWLGFIRLLPAHFSSWSRPFWTAPVLQCSNCSSQFGIICNSSFDGEREVELRQNFSDAI